MKNHQNTALDTLLSAMLIGFIVSICVVGVGVAILALIAVAKSIIWLLALAL